MASCGDALVSVRFLERCIALARRTTQRVAPLPVNAVVNTLCKLVVEVQCFSNEVLLQN